MFDSLTIERHHTSQLHDSPQDDTPWELASQAATAAGLIDLDATPPRDLMHGYVELRRAIEKLEVQSARWLARIDQRQPYLADAYSSSTAFVRHQTRTTGPKASRQVADARALNQMPVVTERAAVGRLSGDQVRSMIQAFEQGGEHFTDAEEMLSDVAEGLSDSSDFRRATQYWLQAVSEPPSGEDPDDEYLHISQTIFGMVKVDGLLNAEHGEALITAVNAATPLPSDSDLRPAAQRRVDGFMHLIATAGGVARKPLMMVHVDLETLAGRRLTEQDRGGAESSPRSAPNGGLAIPPQSQGVRRQRRLHETQRAVLTPEAIDRLACDATLRRVVFGPKSELLDVGRLHRLVTGPMRDAIVARDRTCVVPNCDVPAEWCEIHHFKHWKDGGETNAGNLGPACGFHHVCVHELGFTLIGPAHAPRFFRPDGTEVIAKPWEDRGG